MHSNKGRFVQGGLFICLLPDEIVHYHRTARLAANHQKTQHHQENNMQKTILILFMSISMLTGQESTDFTLTGTLQTAKLEEISGIQIFSRSDSLLWGINDSGNAPELFIFTSTGNLIHTFTILNAVNTDWEDISGFRQNDQAFLAIADIGDNRAVRPECKIYILREPTPDQSIQSITPQRVIRYRYPDGPRDAEALAVDQAGESILICSKRAAPPAIYRLPLNAKSDTFYTAEKITDLYGMPQPKDSQFFLDRLQWQPTAMDINSESTVCCILTYGHLLFYRRGINESWKSALQNQPATKMIPLMQQAESMCLTAKGHSVYITSEKIPAPLFNFQFTQSFLSEY